METGAFGRDAGAGMSVLALADVVCKEVGKAAGEMGSLAVLNVPVPVNMPGTAGMAEKPGYGISGWGATSSSGAGVYGWSSELSSCSNGRRFFFLRGGLMAGGELRQRTQVAK